MSSGVDSSTTGASLFSDSSGGRLAALDAGYPDLGHLRRFGPKGPSDGLGEELALGAALPVDEHHGRIVMEDGSVVGEQATP